MAGSIIWYITTFGCAILFYAIGVYAQRLQKPMWFWSGSEVEPSEITDIKQYNHENGVMWKCYSLWYAAAGVAEIWSSALALTFLVLGCTVGIVLLVYTYSKIYNKFKA